MISLPPLRNAVPRKRPQCPPPHAAAVFPSTGREQSLPVVFTLASLAPRRVDTPEVVKLHAQEMLHQRFAAGPDTASLVR
jgi:hypothetical protein